MLLGYTFKTTLIVLLPDYKGTLCITYFDEHEWSYSFALLRSMPNVINFAIQKKNCRVQKNQDLYFPFPFFISACRHKTIYSGKITNNWTYCFTFIYRMQSDSENLREQMDKQLTCSASALHFIQPFIHDLRYRSLSLSILASKNSKTNICPCFLSWFTLSNMQLHHFIAHHLCCFQNVWNLTFREIQNVITFYAHLSKVGRQQRVWITHIGCTRVEIVMAW